MNLRTRTSIAAVAVASVIGGGVAGAILTGPAAAVAQETGDDGASATEGITTIEDVLGELVADGTLTQAQADAVAEALEDARPERGRRGFHGALRAGLEDVAETIGLTVEELRTALQEGESLADIAAANGAAVQDVIDVLVANAQERLDAAVEAGRLTADEAAEKAAEIETRITDMVNGELDFGRRGGPGRGPDSGSEADAAASEAVVNA